MKPNNNRQLKIKPAYNYSIRSLTLLFNRCFSDYVTGPVRLQSELLSNLICNNRVDLRLSKVVTHRDTLVAFMLVATWGDECRIASMGVSPKYRSNGIGEKMLESAFKELRKKRFQSINLEVFEDNKPALNLYTKKGFFPIRELHGFNAETPEGVTRRKMNQISIQEAARRLTNIDRGELPWQIGPVAAARMRSPSIAYELGSLNAIISNPESSNIIIQSLFSTASPVFRTRLRHLVQGLFSKHPGKNWIVNPIYPKESSNVFLPLGFKRQRQIQLLLKRQIT